MKLFLETSLNLANRYTTTSTYNYKQNKTKQNKVFDAIYYDFCLTQTYF